MPLKNRQAFPPGGFQYFQAETGWNMPGGKTFVDAVAAIITHRQGNPRFGLSVKEDEVAGQLDTYTCHRINFDVNYCTPEPESQKKTKVLPSEPLPPPSPAPLPAVSLPSFPARLAG